MRKVWDIPSLQREKLKKNILVALKCHFDNEKDIPKVIRLHFVKEEVPTYA